MYRRREEEGWNTIQMWTERKEKGLVLMGGDLNAWAGIQGGEVCDKEREVFKSIAKHKEMDQEGFLNR